GPVCGRDRNVEDKRVGIDPRPARVPRREHHRARARIEDRAYLRAVDLGVDLKMPVTSGPECRRSPHFVHDRGARNQFAEDSGGNAPEIVTIGVADEGDAEDASPECKVREDLRRLATTGKSGRREDDEKDQQRNELTRLLLRQPHEAPGIRIDEKGYAHRNEEGDADEEHATAFRSAYLAIKASTAAISSRREPGEEVAPGREPVAHDIEECPHARGSPQVSVRH